MATLSNILSFARAQAQTDSNGLTDANGIIFANEALVDFTRRLIDAGVDAAQLQEAYTSTTAGTGTYAYPSDMFFLKTIEANYVNTNDQDYITVEQVDISNLPQGTSFSWLRKNQNRNSPQFDDHGDWFEIFPTPTSGDNLTNAIKIFYFLEPTEYSATSDTISYPVSLDYRTLGWRIVYSYFKSLGKVNEANDAGLEYEKRVKQLIETLSRGSQQPVKASTIRMTGWQY